MIWDIDLRECSSTASLNSRWVSISSDDLWLYSNVTVHIISLLVFHRKDKNNYRNFQIIGKLSALITRNVHGNTANRSSIPRFVVSLRHKIVSQGQENDISSCRHLYLRIRNRPSRLSLQRHTSTFRLKTSMARREEEDEVKSES